jgi:hypothetical protein
LICRKCLSPHLPKKILDAKEGKEGIYVSDTADTGAGGIFGWFMEIGAAGDFEKAASVFKTAAVLVDRLASIGAAPHL